MPHYKRHNRYRSVGAVLATTGFTLISVVGLFITLSPVTSENQTTPNDLQLPRDFHNRFARSARVVENGQMMTDPNVPEVPFPQPDATAPLDRSEFFRMQRADENGQIAPGVMARALQHRRAMLSRAGSIADAGIDSTRWTWMGPGNIGGRVLSIVIHPVRTDEMLIGSAGGGIWKTTDGGANWRAINDFLGSLSVATLAIDPQSPDTVYAGTGELSGAIGPIQGAGVYKSTDFGDTWTVLFATVDRATGGPWNFTNRLAVHPTNSSVILAGTANGGIFRSTIGGITWSNELSTNFIGDIEFHPTDGTQAIAGDCCTAVSGNRPNVFYYDATAAGGPTWTRASFTGTLGSTTLTSVGDCIPGSGANDKIVVASTSVFRENDSITIGPTFATSIQTVIDSTQLCLNGSVSPTLPSGTTVSIRPTGRVELAYARSNPSIVYMSSPSASGSLWKSTDGGQSYVPVATRLGHMWGAGNYNNAIWVDPTDANHVLLGGGDLIITEDGGMTFRAGGEGGHADRHWIVEHPDFDGTTNRVVFVGSDGGIFKASDVRMLGMEKGVVLESLSNNLGITQFIHMDVDTATGQMLGGTQDNGTLLFDPALGTNGWTKHTGGDGGFSWIDPDDPSFKITEYVRARVIRNRRFFHAADVDRNGKCCSDEGQDDGFNCIAVADPPPAGSITDACENNALFYAPTMMDPVNPRRFLVGARSLWRTTDSHADPIVWDTIKGPAGLCNAASMNTGVACAVDTDCSGGSSAACVLSLISTIDISPTNPNVVWIAYSDGTVYRTSNGTATSPTWLRVDNSAPTVPDPFAGPLPRLMCTRLRIDTSNANRVYVTYGGYQSANLWKTDDAGASWQLISGSRTCDPARRPATALPCIHVLTIQVHPSQPGWLYVGTDLGIYTSENDGVSWSASNDGPANVIIQDLTWNDNEQLFAVTHGRGIFRTAPIVPDCDGNLIDDRIELALRDCNENFRIDSCDINSGESLDCNTNSVPDECEIAVSSTAPGGPFFCVIDCNTDCDDNGIPDVCDPDCDGNGQPDACDLQSALTFVRQTQYIAGLAPSSIASADFNDDGFGDLAVANWESSDISVLMNRGNNTFGTWLEYEAAANYSTRDVSAIPWAVTTGDFDQDGDQDIAYVVESGDIFRLSSDLGVMLNNGDGTFSWPGFTPIHLLNVGPFRCEDLKAGDLDGDGFPELVVANTSSAGGTGQLKITIIKNGGLNTSGGWRGFRRPLGLDAFPGVGRKPVSIALGKFNADGHLDIAVANESSDDVSILINDGTGVFAPAVSIPVGVAPAALDASDLTGNGFDDLVIGRHVSGLVGMLRANGDGSFTPLPQIGTDLGSVDAILLADLDREGSPDIVAGQDTASAPSILLNSSTGMFGLPFRAGTGSPVVSITALDVDADGDLDIASVGGNSTSRVIVIRNDTDIDCNRNNVPDNCEIAAGRPDRDGGGLLDECEVGACDADGDGDCDLADYRRMNECWRGPNIPCGGSSVAGAGVAARDLDLDFDFDLQDFAILQRSFTAPRDCCATHGPGCNDYAIELCVCEVNPECCSGTWDETCVDAVSLLGCGTCGPEAQCGDGVCQSGEDCVTCGVDCGLCVGACCEANDTIGCVDPRAQSCVCTVRPQCCTDVWDEACAAMASDTCTACCGDGVCGLGEGCEGCPDDCLDCPPGCGNTFCDLGEDCRSCPTDCGTCPIICGDTVCESGETCAKCNDDCGNCTGSCCLDNGTIGCIDPLVTDCVCALLPKCCMTGWDADCAKAAEQCDTCGGDCCVANGSPGCSDQTVEACVCAQDEFCCDTEWDNTCITEITTLGCGICPGSCCLVNTTPGCIDPDVQACVCSFMATCCTTVWDAPCALAAEQCGSCSGDCCSANGTPGCFDQTVEACVCAQDPFCCNNNWDNTCVDEVATFGCGVCADNPPAVLITSPPADTSMSDLAFVYDGFDQALGLYYKEVTFKGEALDPEDGFLSGGSLVWTTDRTDIQPMGQAQLGTGVTITVTLYSNVCAGVWHEITLTATDSAGNTVTTKRRIFIWIVC